jgi:hypothetical protein
VAAWERGPTIIPTAIALPMVSAPSSPTAPAAQAQPTSYPMRPSPVTYGPYGRVTASPRPLPLPHTATTVEYNLAAAAYNPLPAPTAQPSEQPYVPPKVQYPAGAFILPSPELRPGPPRYEAVAVVDEFSKTRPDANYHAYVEREYAIQLARGSQPEELEKTRLWLATQSNPVKPQEPPAVRATRLRHPPVPRPRHLAMLLHMPNRLS